MTRGMWRWEDGSEVRVADDPYELMDMLHRAGLYVNDAEGVPNSEGGPIAGYLREVLRQVGEDPLAVLLSELHDVSVHTDRASDLMRRIYEGFRRHETECGRAPVEGHDYEIPGVVRVPWVEEDDEE